MARCYVRREERLPQAHAGYSVNPQLYLLAEDETHTTSHSGFSSHRLHTCLQTPTVRSVCLTFSKAPVRRTLCVAWTVQLSRYHSSCLFSTGSACSLMLDLSPSGCVGESGQTAFLFLVSVFCLLQVLI